MNRSHAPCRRRGVSFALVSASLLATAAAQEPAVRAAGTPDGAARPLATAVVPIHTAPVDGGVAYGVWAAGADYKVSFHDGATFVPYLGREYPHNQPWSWRTASVTLGEVELVTRAPRLAHDGVRAEYDLGLVVEAYDVRLDGVEQTFVVGARVSGGDLVVRGEVSSRLRADAVAARHGGLSFVDDRGHELVHYGAATAVDAAGRSRAMTTSYDDGRITLRLDAAWLDGAEFPVVVDPLVGPGAQIQGNTRYEVDVARDTETTSQSNWVAYSVFASAADSDLAMRRYYDNGQLASLAFEDITSSWSTRRPAVAFNAYSDKGVVTFDRYFPNSSAIGVRAHGHLRFDSGMNTSYDAVPATDSAWRSDIGGTALGILGPEMAVVWQQENNIGGPFQNTVGSDVYLSLYDSANGTFAPPVQVTTALFSDYERPCLSEVATDQASWALAYQGRSNVVTNALVDVYVRRIDNQGTVGAATRIDAGYSGHQFAPKIDGSSGRYLCAFVATGPTILPPTGVNGSKVRSVRVDIDYTGAVTEPHGTVELQSNSDNRLEVGDVAEDWNTESHWGVLFRSNVTENLYLRIVGFRGVQVRAETVFTAGAGQSSVQGGLSFDRIHDTIGIAYAVNQAGPDYVTMDRFDYVPVGAAYTNGIGCSSAQIAWHGSQQIGSEASRVQVTGANGNSIHTAIVAVAPASAPLFHVPPIQDGCWLLVANTGPDFLGMMPIEFGQAYWPLPLPENLPSMTLFVQGWHTIGGSGSDAFDFVSTERLIVSLVK